MIDAPPKESGWTEEKRQEASERARLQHQARAAVSGKSGGTGPGIAASSQVESDSDPNALSEMDQIKLALGSKTNVTYNQMVHSEDDNLTTDSGGVAVTHTREKRIRLYKPTGECRVVPASNMERLLDQKDGRWTTKCPKCGTDCQGSPWGCGKVPQPQYYECPVPACNMESGGPKRFYVKAVVARAENTDPNRIHDELFASNAGVDLAKSQMYAHINAYHPDYAVATKVPGAER